MDSGSSSRRISYAEKKKKSPTEADGGLVWRPHQYFPKSMLRKVQVMYYLARKSGRLQHPHYIELTLPHDHPLRLKHVLDRLVALRGSGMPSQYSWSCKRSYMAGYVWYDLGANDIIHSSSEVGPKYVLKGSEIVQDASGTPKQTKPEEKESGVGRWILKLMACGTTSSKAKKNAAKNSNVKMETEKEKEESSGSIVPPFNESNQER